MLLKSFDVEYGKFSKEFDRLGKHISQTQVKYEEVAGVRDKQLTRIIEKIKTGEVLVQEKTLPALESGVLETLDPIKTSP
jgi:DNA anti-recombination protein RmuC